MQEDKFVAFKMLVNLREKGIVLRDFFLFSCDFWFHMSWGLHAKLTGNKPADLDHSKPSH